MKNWFLFLISVFLFSCQQKENKKTSADSPMPVVQEEKKQENKQVGDTISMNFKNEENVFSAEGHLDSLNSKIYVKFKNEDLGKLNAQIIPDTGKGNIRFNQIIFPDKTSDGPFGMDMKMPLKQKGTHIFVIGHSLMADNPYYGNFKVQLKIQKE
ncbi:hypothetical protein BSF41_16100 [Flavobacterium sp. ACN2]|uniref:hypothetical protein n=1 Tax=unclassified Flavobacterium TaxID=196869 RepID=UPI000BB3ABC7|nr:MULTISPECIES: hypothetical protein [unclassified Flavobacterium]MDY0986147.1 hypothetical protein [Flavobacterium sp. CFBP9031]PBI90904.1 hypothetical protein BSF41_16100 [Flavobacterium sp. ACN2]